MSSCLFFGFLSLACTQEQPEKFEFQQIGNTMGTTFSVKIPTLPDGLVDSNLQRDINRILRRISDRMSTYRSDSELSRFNRSRTTDWVDASSELVEVVRQAQQISRLSAGAFDITIGPLVNLWGFGPKGAVRKMPNNQQVSALLDRIGYKYLLVRSSPPALRKTKPKLYLDLSSLAKGYGVDQVADHLESMGIQNYLLEIGGELRAKGTKKDGIPWRIAIEKPEPGRRAVEAVLELDNIAVATSGDYRNYFEAGGERFSHTIDPRTGRPIKHKLASITVLSHTAMHADALATAFMVLGPDASFKLAEREKIPALLIVKAEHGFTRVSTSGFPRPK